MLVRLYRGKRRQNELLRVYGNDYRTDGVGKECGGSCCELFFLRVRYRSARKRNILPQVQRAHNGICGADSFRRRKRRSSAMPHGRAYEIPLADKRLRTVGAVELDSKTAIGAS